MDSEQNKQEPKAEGTVIEPEKPAKKIGRPSNIGNVDLKLVEQYAALGFTEYEIGLMLGLGNKSIKRYKKKSPALLEAITRGKLRADSVVLNSLYKKAKNGDVTAEIFWMKNRQPDRWRDRQPGDSKDNPLNLHLKLVDIINNLNKGEPRSLPEKTADGKDSGGGKNDKDDREGKKEDGK